MKTIERRNSYAATALALVAVMFLAPLAALGQTQIPMPKNKYSTSDDVRLGQQAAQQVYQQMPILRDETVRAYVNRVGQSLVAAIPPQYQHPEFRFSFDVVDARDINAFALPGGPMFVNRGMIEAAHNEGEMAGVMAHEISHVALRHATAQQTKLTSAKSTVLGIGAILGGAILGGQAGAAAGQTVFQVYATKYSREYESQADILGAQIMARAGYDPRDLANMFRTIAQQGGSSGPEWLSSHPNPGNREQRILQEAAMLRVEGGRSDTAEFRQIQSRLGGYPRARTMEEIARSGQRYPNQGGGQYPDQNYPADNGGGGVYARGERVAYPSTRYSTQRTNLFSVAVPSNWRQLGGDQNSVSYAPEGAYGSQGITHGVMFSVAQSNNSDLQRASQEVVQGLMQSNNYLRQQSGFTRTTVDGRAALATTLAGRSPITGQNERVTIVTTTLGNGQVFYMAAVSPQNEYGTYQRAFNDILRSLQLNGY
ncbi:MAG TPA: M48 family metallopeptidase [Pyrinomonadaceae bacterium]|nr:M48 family metallopeptidase [Pyrinomonadaceae bacterium]